MYSLEWLVLSLLQCVGATIPEYHNFQIRKLQLANSELKKHVRTVESEKAVLVTCLSRVQDTVPTHLLQEANIRLPSSIQAPSFTSTPMHNFIGTYVVSCTIILCRSAGSDHDTPLVSRASLLQPQRFCKSNFTNSKVIFLF